MTGVAPFCHDARHAVDDAAGRRNPMPTSEPDLPTNEAAPELGAAREAVARFCVHFERALAEVAAAREALEAAAAQDGADAAARREEADDLIRTLARETLAMAPIVLKSWTDPGLEWFQHFLERIEAWLRQPGRSYPPGWLEPLRAAEREGQHGARPRLPA
jgi:hypothetical protein